jgi:cytochrome c peroxidase
MNRMKLLVFGGLLLACFTLVKCSEVSNLDFLTINGATPYNLQSPDHFPNILINPENPLTEEGVALGKRLFFDPILSRNNNVSCGSCHFQNLSFSDDRKLSIGTHGDSTQFHSMPLFNMAWMNEFFWNGRAKSREEQALKPVVNPLEMDMTWPEAVERLQEDEEYPFLFNLAFGTFEIDSNLVAAALVQFEMTLISGNSKFDRFVRGEEPLTQIEEFGYSIFKSELGDCFHCHSDNLLFTDNGFHNNGLDTEVNLQPGLNEVTGKPDDIGRFKTPTLRNLVYTAPYMHDGRFQTLDQVIEFYSTEVHANSTVDVLMKKSEQGGIQLQPIQKQALKAFLLTLTDSTVITNPDYQNPFE